MFYVDEITAVVDDSRNADNKPLIELTAFDGMRSCEFLKHRNLSIG